MLNQFINEFMSRFEFEGLTFDDISLTTLYADFLPDETDVSSKFTRNVALKIPFSSAAMDTVTEKDMAIAMARLGGIGVIHKNLSVEEQVEEVARVKHYLNGFIVDPVVFNINQTVDEIVAEKERKNYSFCGFPIVDDDGQLKGIITSKDVKFLTDFSVKVSEVMTTNLITAPWGTDINQAMDIMLAHKVGKLPIVNDDGLFKGLYSFHDVKAIVNRIEPDYNRDSKHRLRVAAAVGPYNDGRIESLIKAEVDVLVLDTAHGHSKGVVETLKMIKNTYGDIVDVVAGNIATGEAAKDLIDAGADAVKVGIGPGSICTTRVVAGVGIPQISAIYNAKKAIGDEVPVIADGGIKQTGDIAKAIAVGADSTMMGSVLAATEESPGEKIIHQGRRFVVYRGMGSLGAMRKAKGSRERYGQRDVENDKQLVPQGIEGLVPYRGSTAEVLHQFVGGLRNSLGYCGSRDLREFQSKVRFCRVSSAGLREAHPHDIKINKDAPNYTPV